MPSDIMLCRPVRHAAEADEGLHAIGIPLHLPLHRQEPGKLRVHFNGQQVRFRRREAPQHRLQKTHQGLVAMVRNDLCQTPKFSGNRSQTPPAAAVRLLNLHAAKEKSGEEGLFGCVRHPDNFGGRAAVGQLLACR